MATKKKPRTKRKRAAKKQPAAKRKPTAKKKPGVKRAVKKREVKRPVKKPAQKTKAAAKRRAPARTLGGAVVTGRMLAAGGTVRDGVVALLADQLRVSKADADGKAIRALVAACGPNIQSLVASAINHDWSSLTRQFRQSDVSCDDTADSLAEEIVNRMS